MDILRRCITESSLLDLLRTSGRSDRTKFKRQVLAPLLEAGWIEMTVPDKLTSSQQKYRLTEKGRLLLQGMS